MTPLVSDQIMLPVMLSVRQRYRRERAELFIRSSLQEKDLAIKFLCQELDMSRTTLCRLFQQEGGVEEYIIAQRLDRVRNTLLAEENYGSLANLARIWRFSDASHLSRRFKARYGSPPKRYKQLNTNRGYAVGGERNYPTQCGYVPPAISAAERVTNLEKENQELKSLLVV